MTQHELNLILLKTNKSKNDFDLFVETGSYLGETLNEIRNNFNKIISIEITEKYSNYCKQRYINDKNIEIIKGDSLLVLPDLIDKNKNKKFLFFLDAHCSAGDTGKNDMDVPLIEELKIINDKCDDEVFIIVDDADLFNRKFELLTWEGINEKNIFDVVNNRLLYFFHTDDIRNSTKKRLIILLNAKSN